MKTYFTRFLIAVYFLLGLSAFAQTAVGNSGSSSGDGPALQIGTDGFPANFKLTYDAIVSYYNDTVTRGYSSVYGPAVLEPLSGKSFATAVGNDGGGAILRRLLAQPLSFRIANPKDNYIIVQANLHDADGRTIFHGARAYNAVLGEKGPWWYIPLDNEGVQLVLSEDRPLLAIPGVDAISIIPKTANGQWAGPEFSVDSTWNERTGVNEFNFDLRRLPLYGQVILTRYDKAGLSEKSYDIASGKPSEVSQHTVVFNGGIYGMKSFTDRGMAPGEHLKATARIRRWEKSPLFDITVEESGDVGDRPIDISVVMVDENDNVIATATSLQARKAEDRFEWSQPDGLENGAVSGAIEKGRYYVIFGWPDGTFFEPGTSNPGKGVSEPAVY